MKGRIFAVIIAGLFGFAGVESAGAKEANVSTIAADAAMHKGDNHRGGHGARHHHRRHGRVHRAHKGHHHHARHHKAHRGHHIHGHKHHGVRHRSHR